MSTEEIKPEYQRFVVDESTYETIIPSKVANKKKWVRPNPKEIVSFLPGTILELNVKAGDAVKEGDKLLVFEAMKMHTTINAPFAGTIKLIAANAGDKVPKGQLLVEFE